jgi:hypothetical protein
MKSNPLLVIVLALAAATPHATQAKTKSESKPTEVKVIVPFAIPVGVPVATFAPYFYSYQQFQAPLSDFRPPNSDFTPHSELSAPHLNSSVETHCAACHSGPSPKAGLSMENVSTLSPIDRLRAIRAVATGQMPKGQSLSAEEIRSLITELSNGQ